VSVVRLNITSVAKVPASFNVFKFSFFSIFNILILSVEKTKSAKVISLKNKIV